MAAVLMVAAVLWLFLTNCYSYFGCFASSHLKFDLSLGFNTEDVAAEFDLQRANDTSFAPVVDTTRDFPLINFTANPSSTVDGQQKRNNGRLKYKQSLTFPFAAVPSFNTSFTFLIQTTTSYGSSGDGLAFALTSDAEPPLNSSGGFLGLTPQNTNDQQDHSFFALEFDTYQNLGPGGFDDPSASHIGINVNSLNSVYVHNTADNASELYLYRNYYIRAWLQYDASEPSVRVWATNVTLDGSDTLDRPSEPIFQVPDLNLSQKIHTDQLYAVIGATSGAASEGHSLFAWSFESAGVAADPASAPPAAVGIGGMAAGPSPPPSDSTSRLPVILGVVAALLVMETAAIVCVFIIQRCRRNQQHRWRPTATIGVAECGATSMWGRNELEEWVHNCGYDDFRSACNDFSDKNIVGEGGCGVVYSGVLRNGMEVAVKKMKQVVVRKDFYREVDILRRLDHPNLLPLLAWCSAVGDDSVSQPPDAPYIGGAGGHAHANCGGLDQAAAAGMLLVYPFIRNGSLQRYIASTDMSVRQLLGRERRLQILCQVSEALAYLHSQNCVHRDVKASNILLTERFDAMVGDFGLARVGRPDKSKVEVTVAAAGTPGYMAPELIAAADSWSHVQQTTKEEHAQQESESETTTSAGAHVRQLVSYKADVYSFGVLALKVASGRMYSHSDIPRLGWALQRSVNSYEQGGFVELLDPALRQGQNGELAVEELQQWRCVFQLGIRCLSWSPAERPEMGKVSQALTAVRLTRFPELLDSLVLLL